MARLDHGGRASGGAERRGERKAGNGCERSHVKTLALADSEFRVCFA
jgi:hypothetical protein